MSDDDKPMTKAEQRAAANRPMTANPADEVQAADEASEAEARAQAEHEAHGKDDAKAEADKQAADADALAKERAERTTGDISGIPAAAAFWDRIEAARFAHRNQGHDDTMQLIDDLYAGLMHVEGKLAGHG